MIDAEVIIQYILILNFLRPRRPKQNDTYYNSLNLLIWYNPRYRWVCIFIWCYGYIFWRYMYNRIESIRNISVFNNSVRRNFTQYAQSGIWLFHFRNQFGIILNSNIQFDFMISFSTVACCACEWTHKRKSLVNDGEISKCYFCFFPQFTFYLSNAHVYVVLT